MPDVENGKRRKGSNSIIWWIVSKSMYINSYYHERHIDRFRHIFRNWNPHSIQFLSPQRHCRSSTYSSTRKVMNSSLASTSASLKVAHQCDECKTRQSSRWYRSVVSNQFICNTCRTREYRNVVRKETRGLVCPQCGATDSLIWLKSMTTKSALCKECFLTERRRILSVNGGLLDSTPNNECRKDCGNLCSKVPNMSPGITDEADAKISSREEVSEKYTMDEAVDLLFFLRYGTDQYGNTAPTTGHERDAK